MWEYIVYAVAGIIIVLHAIGTFGENLAERTSNGRKYQENWRIRR